MKLDNQSKYESLNGWSNELQVYVTIVQKISNNCADFCTTNNVSLLISSLNVFQLVKKCYSTKSALFSRETLFARKILNLKVA
jgi:hypothetical protein